MSHLFSPFYGIILLLDSQFVINQLDPRLTFFITHLLLFAFFPLMLLAA